LPDALTPAENTANPPGVTGALPESAPKVSALRKLLQVTLGYVTLLSIFALFVVATMGQKHSILRDNERQHLTQTIDRLQADNLRGSEIGMTSLFSDTPPALSHLYEAMAEPGLPDSARRDIENAALHLKLAILKRILSSETYEKNYAFKILAVVNTVNLLDHNRVLRDSLYLVGELHVGTAVGPIDSFDVFITPGMGHQALVNTDLSVTVTVGAKTAVIPLERCGVKPIGTRKSESYLYRLRIPVERLDDGETLGVSVAYSSDQPVGSRGEPVPFSLYFFDPDRYALGVERVDGLITSDVPSWYHQFCFDMRDIDLLQDCVDNGPRLILNEEDSSTLGAAGTRTTAAARFRFTVFRPTTPIIVGFIGSGPIS